MPTRSQYKDLHPAPNIGINHLTSPATPKASPEKIRPSLSKWLLKEDEEEQREVIRNLFSDVFNQIA